MAKLKGAVVVDKEGCKGCELCVEACPEDVLALYNEVNSRGYHFSYMKYPDLCIGCANCGVVCPDTCISIYRVRL
jgi:2-oxoglutarate ferredoxin oxidoreductase subunit delta